MATMTTTTTIIKKFATGKELVEWKNNPMTAKLYTIKYVDWTTNSVKVEPLPLN